MLRDLKVHQTIHTPGLKPYRCEFVSCGKTFRVAANYYAHKKTHRKAAEKEAQEKMNLEAAVAEIGEFIQVASQSHSHLHTLQAMEIAPPVTINETYMEQNHLSHLSDNETAFSLSVGNNSSGTNIDYHSSESLQYPSESPGFLKQILLGQYDK